MEKLEKLNNDVIELKGKVEDQEKSINFLEKSFSTIDRKLSKLLILEEQTKSRFQHHQLLCQEAFDLRYTMKVNFRQSVIEILNSVRDEDLRITNTKSNLISNILNSLWKIAMAIGMLYIVIGPILK